MVSANIEYLKDNGPAIKKELPNTAVSRHDMIKGVRSFKVPSTSSFSTQSLRAVYYLEEHDGTDIIEKWLSENEHVVENAKRRGVRYALLNASSQFRDAVDEVFPVNAEPV